MMLRRLKSDRWLLLAAALLILLPLPKLLVSLGLITGDATAMWPPTHYMQRGTEVFVYAVFALSYDLLLGFSGIVSFGHSLFLALGAYSVAIVVMKLHLPLWVALPTAILVPLVISVVVGALSLRLKGHYFAMITLALAEVGHVLANQLTPWTGGADGLSVRVPMWMVNRTNDYFLGLLFVIAMFLLVRRVTRSPLGRVLEAIRENDNRAEALGYNVTAYKVAAMAVSGVVAGLAGFAMATIDSRFAIASLATTGPTIEVLLMTVLGGAGTLIGPMIGAAVVRLLAYILPTLVDISPLFQRWQFILGLIYIGTVLFLPFGIVGIFRAKVRKAA